MSKTIIPLILLIALGGIYFLTKDNDNDTSIVLEDRDFVVKDRELIDIITINRPGYPELHLSKSEGGWLLNQRRKASPHVMRNLLSVLTRMELDYIPPRTKYNKIMQDIKDLGISVTTYDKEGNVLSDFIVGKNNNVESGTYVIKKGAKQPYVMIVPAVSGGIRNYFTLSDMNLRDKTVMDVNSDDIVKITMDYKKNRINSFIINKDNGGELEIEPMVPTDRTMNVQQNQNLLDAYVKSFKKIGAENIMTGRPDMDSISHHIPFIELAIDLKDGSQLGYSFYPVMDIVDPGTEIKSVIDLDKIDRYYMFSTDGQSYIVQQRLVKNIIKPINYFGL
jgi:hypothetical protein